MYKVSVAGLIIEEKTVIKIKAPRLIIHKSGAFI